MNWDLFVAFMVITAILVIVPGPIVTLVIATSASQGLRSGLAAVVGTTVGNALLLAAIAFGLTWVLQNAAELFELLRWVGAAYLIWVGFQMWRRAEAGASKVIGYRVNFSRGLIVALSNPKSIAFFTAFLPQFVDASLPAAPQLAVMCTVSVLLAAVTDTGWAIAAGLGRAWLVQPAQARWLGRTSGLLLIGGGIWLSLARR